jgi:hypothetical protein
VALGKTGEKNCGVICVIFIISVDLSYFPFSAPMELLCPAGRTDFRHQLGGHIRLFNLKCRGFGQPPPFSLRVSSSRILAV